MFGAKEAKVSPDTDLLDSIKIANTDNRFTFYLNGSRHNIYLDANPGGYSRADFISQLNTKLSGLGISAVAKGDSFELVGDPYKGISSISIGYDESAGSAMPSFFGQHDVWHEGATADFDADGKLVLTATKSGLPLRVSSTYGSAFQKPTRISNPKYPSPVTGHHSAYHAKIDGNNLGGEYTD